MDSPSLSLCPVGGTISQGKKVEVRDSGSRHHQLCGCCNLQLIQSRVSPSHGPPARVLSPLFFPAKSLLLPKPRGKREHPKDVWFSRPSHVIPTYSAKAEWSSLVWLPSLGFNPSASLPLQPHFRLLLQSVTPASIPYPSSLTGLP